MSDLHKSIQKLILKRERKDVLRKPPTLKQTTDRYIQQLLSSYPLRPIGQGSESDLLLSEETRASHIHILGTTREGKSKLLEQFIRHDIDHGYGATLLDPSDNGQTAYSVLRYCVKQGFDKVCLIDLHDNQLCIPSINPLHFRGLAATDSVVQNLMESIRLLWGQTSFTDTPRIETYLSAVLTALYAAKATIPDGVCFLVKEDRPSHIQRLKILDHLPHYDKSRKILEEVFNAKGQQLFLGEFKASIRRLSPFFDYLPRLLYGSTESPIDFKKLVADKWLILVNLDKTRIWGTAHQRVLGTLVVNEIISAVMDLTFNGWHGRHYLYVDEAGQFATRGLSDIMAYKGKSGLWATLSHQYYDQFEDKQVLAAIENLCKIKVLFYTPNTADRNRMIKDMYTGELKLQAVDAHASQKKQHAVIKIGKEPPITVRIADVPDVQVTVEQLTRFKDERIYKANPWYRTPETIQEEITKRFAVQPSPGIQAAKPSSVKQAHAVKAQPAPDNKPQRPTGKQDVAQSQQPADFGSSKGSSVFDDIANSAALLRQNKGRKATKSNDQGTKKG